MRSDKHLVKPVSSPRLKKTSELAMIAWLGVGIAVASSNLLAGSTGCSTATFEPARKTGVGSRPNQHARSGDFNGDGKLDLVVEDTRGEAYVLLGKGDGYFDSPEPLSPNPFAYSLIHALADFNGDGRSDLIVRDPNPALYLGQSDGGFDRSQADFAFNDWIAQTIVEGDFNGDGKADLAGGLHPQYSTNVVVRLNHGDGTFGPIAEYESGMPVSYLYVKAADIDGDGDLDLIRISDASISKVTSGTVIYSYTNTVSVLMNNGTGTFEIGPSRYAGTWIMSIAAVGDFNGDGKADLACSHHYDFDSFIPQESVGVLLGNGDGTFGMPVIWRTEIRVYWIFAADFNGDGATDLLAADRNGSGWILLGNGDGTFQEGSGLSSDLSYNNPFVVGDFDGDGGPDLAGPTDNGVEVRLNACHPPPEPPNGLWIQRRNQTAVLSWPLIPSGSSLESTTNTALTGWSVVTGNFTTNQNRFELQTPIEGAQRYFRLREPGP